MLSLNARQVAVLTVLTAVSLGIQLAPRPPNVEFTSLFTFIVGLLYGSIIGGFFGGFVMFVNGFLSSWGFGGLMIPFQIVGMAITGIAGGFYKRYTVKMSHARFSIEVAILGAALTLLYDIITNVGVAVTYVLSGISWNIALILAISSGALFSLIHVASNVVLFGSGFVPLLKALQKVPGGEALWLRKELLHSQH
jgi:hypothetical protein